MRVWTECVVDAVDALCNKGMSKIEMRSEEGDILAYWVGTSIRIDIKPCRGSALWKENET